MALAGPPLTYCEGSSVPPWIEMCIAQSLGTLCVVSQHTYVLSHCVDVTRHWMRRFQEQVTISDMKRWQRRDNIYMEKLFHSVILWFSNIPFSSDSELRLMRSEWLLQFSKKWLLDYLVSNCNKRIFINVSWTTFNLSNCIISVSIYFVTVVYF